MGCKNHQYHQRINQQRENSARVRGSSVRTRLTEVVIKVSHAVNDSEKWYTWMTLSTCGRCKEKKCGVRDPHALAELGQYQRRVVGSLHRGGVMVHGEKGGRRKNC